MLKSNFGSNSIALVNIRQLHGHHLFCWSKLRHDDYMHRHIIGSSSIALVNSANCVVIFQLYGELDSANCDVFQLLCYLCLCQKEKPPKAWRFFLSFWFAFIWIERYSLEPKPLIEKIVTVNLVKIVFKIFVFPAWFRVKHNYYTKSRTID